MDFSEIINNIVSFAKTSPIIAIPIGLLIIFLIWRNPKFFLKVTIFVLIIAVVFYMIMSMASSGKSKKEDLIHGRERLMENTP
ncbi:MAG: hypothetical protein AB1610_11715 [Nitrospirota bacterium]